MNCTTEYIFVKNKGTCKRTLLNSKRCQKDARVNLIVTDEKGTSNLGSYYFCRDCADEELKIWRVYS